MRRPFTDVRDLKLARSPSVREDARRRRWALAGVFAAAALVSGLAGYLTAPAPSPSETARTGPFSYFPSE